MERKNHEESKGLRLLHRSRKGLLSIVFSRTGLMAILLVLQFGILGIMFFNFELQFVNYYGGSLLVSIFTVLYLLNTNSAETTKITWIVIVMVLPVFGTLLYLYTKLDVGHRTQKLRVSQIMKETSTVLPKNEALEKSLKETDGGVAALARYINRNGCHPIYINTDVTYFPSGEAKFEELIRQLEMAEKYIFLEYFIIDEGYMWGRVLEILAEKAKAGVDVRVMYDGICELTVLPIDYTARIKKLGIKCKAFAKVRPFVSTHYNYRDHRKIVVIDGKVAFNGGINLADEYINRIEKYGHWKDTAVMLRGEAVKSFTLMFLQMWNINERKSDYSLVCDPVDHSNSVGAKGYVIPYGDCPLDGDRLGERVYMDMLNRAENYANIMSPYLILDGEMETAIKFAAERGVEVTLIVPGIPDKKIPYALAKTHYKSLLQSGVKIYEYTPGFVHAKVFECDGREAVVGTINLDYRSFYHHFECATYIYGADCIGDIEEDFAKTKEKCSKVTFETVKKEKLVYKIVGYLVKAFSPLL